MVVRVPRRIAVITTSRADYGILRYVARALAACPNVEFGFLVSGTHLIAAHGGTVGEIEADDMPILERIELGLTSDEPPQLALAMAAATRGFGEAFARHGIDIVLTLGDRFEMLAATIATLPFRLPVAHLHGGELSFGATDEIIRHAMTKLSHLHFVSTQAHGRRVAQMGEEAWRITVSGAPALDTLEFITLPDRATLERRVGLDLGDPPLLVTIHPETVSQISPEAQAQALLAALKEQTKPIVFTAPNADQGGLTLMKAIRTFAAERPNTLMVESLGNENYFGLMKIAAAMVGNSSSGIIEAASFALPVVNIGQRQDGRLRAPNVVDCGWALEEIRHAVFTVLNPVFKRNLAVQINPYGDGHAGERIADVLSNVDLNHRLLRKLFVDWDNASEKQ